MFRPQGPGSKDALNADPSTCFLKKRDFKFQFGLSDLVCIKELDRPARVEQLIVDCSGITYKVTYFNNGERKTSYCWGDELEPII